MREAIVKRGGGMTISNVVTKIRRGADPDGPWKHAVVTGRRFPEEKLLGIVILQTDSDDMLVNRISPQVWLLPEGAFVRPD